MRLSELKPGQRGRIVGIKGEGTLRRRFQTMGILPGEEVVVEKVAPLGDPIDVVIKGYHLSLRKSEGDLIEVEESTMKNYKHSKNLLEKEYYDK